MGPDAEGSDQTETALLVGEDPDHQGPAFPETPQDHVQGPAVDKNQLASQQLAYGLADHLGLIRLA